jgi:hypothetical protein
MPALPTSTPKPLVSFMGGLKSLCLFTPDNSQEDSETGALQMHKPFLYFDHSSSLGYVIASCPYMVQPSLSQEMRSAETEQFGALGFSCRWGAYSLPPLAKCRGTSKACSITRFGGEAVWLHNLWGVVSAALRWATLSPQHPQ